jgi:DNA-binding protein H-NS
MPNTDTAKEISGARPFLWQTPWDMILRETRNSDKGQYMAKMDLEKLSLDELKSLRKDVDKAIGDYEKRRRQEALAAAESAASAAGYSLSELLGEVKGKKGKGTVNPPKYRHPENAALTWTGKGRQPAWIKEAVEKGKPLEDFLITA